jgi:hypothetical protein
MRGENVYKVLAGKTAQKTEADMGDWFGRYGVDSPG